jgi:hypothetical protein
LAFSGRTRQALLTIEVGREAPEGGEGSTFEACLNLTRKRSTSPTKNNGGNAMPMSSAGRRFLLCAAALGLGMLAGNVRAQELKDVQAAKTPLALEQEGSFYVGGHAAHVAITGWDELGPDFGRMFGMPGDTTIGQMYVQFQKPVGWQKNVPIVFLHGCCLSSKTWETTPDGRMGWYEYFARMGFPTYLAEQSGRARSGFDPSGFNEVRAGELTPDKQKRVLIPTYQFAWSIFRFGPKYGSPWPDEQFPIEQVDQLYKQMIPDLILTEVPSLGKEFSSPTTDNPTVQNIAELAKDLGGAILVGHSQSSGMPTQAVLKGMPGIKGIIQLETGCFTNLTPPEVSQLAKVPMLVMVADHWGTPQPPPECNAEMAQINKAGGDMTFISLPAIGIHGNSHMFMQDKNDLQVADVIIKWIDQHVEHKTAQAN